jgi:AraC-like DNA-binding protein
LTHQAQRSPALTATDAAGQQSRHIVAQSRNRLVLLDASALTHVKTRPKEQVMHAIDWPEAASMTIGVAHSSTDLAAIVATTLQSLNFKVQVWKDSPSARDVSACDFVVADRQCMRLLADRGLRAARPVQSNTSPIRAFRGGLAPGVLRRVKDHIENALTTKVDLRGLAQLAGLSECHFARAFKQSMGVPPHRYVMSRRIAVAASMIETTQTPLTEVALTTGFSDHSHFTRVFASVTGETPSSYRHRHR